VTADRLTMALHFLPKELREKFVAEHPIQAALFVLFGLAMIGVAIWFMVAK